MLAAAYRVLGPLQVGSAIAALQALASASMAELRHKSRH